MSTQRTGLKARFDTICLRIIGCIVATDPLQNAHYSLIDNLEDCKEHNDKEKITAIVLGIMKQILHDRHSPSENDITQFFKKTVTHRLRDYNVPDAIRVEALKAAFEHHAQTIHLQQVASQSFPSLSQEQ